MPPDGLLDAADEAADVLGDVYGESLRSVIAFRDTDSEHSDADESPAGSQFAWNVVYKNPEVSVPENLDASVTESGLDSMTTGGREQIGLRHHGKLEAFITQHAEVTVVTVPDAPGTGIRITLTTTDFDKNRVIGRVDDLLESVD